MPFRLSNTLLAFQRFTNEVFSDLLDICMVIYLDDILIYSNNLESHKNHVTVWGLHGQRTLDGTLTYVAITSSGINCALKNSKGR